jgi:SAM-dependent methyltransferase
LVEPAIGFAAALREKGYEVYSGMKDALGHHAGRIQLITSYDVIEHVDDPQAFLQDIHDLLEPGGAAFVGTPTDCPLLRGLLGAEFDSFLFSVQHPWALSRRSLELMARKCGFSEYSVRFFQRFGMGNLLSWLKTGEPHGDVPCDFVTRSLDVVYKSEMAREETADYMVMRLEKQGKRI